MNSSAVRRPDGAAGSPDTASGRMDAAPRAGPHAGPHADFGAGALERLLFDPATAHQAGRLMPPDDAAWSLEFPGLEALLPVEPRGQRLRVCIATADVIGPVRNGGIGTTYAALSKLLAADGHEVTLLFLHGRLSENEDFDHWVADYATRGINLVPVPNYASEHRIAGPCRRWLAPSYNMLQYLLAHPFDVVHVSEWLGQAAMSLQAKRQGVVLRDTMFIVKASSPWLWNRLYGAQPLPFDDDLVRIAAERRSVELADMVIGGSLHLLRWMASVGYRMPPGRCFVQPNVTDLDWLPPAARSRRDELARIDRQPRLPVDELVFFGRLEERKGLLTFLAALRFMIARGLALPRKVTFLGKPSAVIGEYGTVLDLIETATADWPIEVATLTDVQQPQAIAYLMESSRLAVMPSAIENSSLAVYEALICGIPFVATNTGGTAELIDPHDRGQVLCEAHPLPLAGKLDEAVREGGAVARLAFDDTLNLHTWSSFHLGLADGLKAYFLDPEPPEPPPGSVAVCLYSPPSGANDWPGIEDTLASLATQTQQPARVVIAAALQQPDAKRRIERIAEQHGLRAEVLDAAWFGAGFAFNAATAGAREDFLLFVAAGATLRPEALATLARTATLGHADVLAYAHRRPGGGQAGALHIPLIAGIGEVFLPDASRDLPLFVRRTAFSAAGGFTTDMDLIGHEREFVARALTHGLYCDTVVRELGAVAEPDSQALPASRERSLMRQVRPILAAAPLALRELLLAGASAGIRGARPGVEDGPRPAAGPAHAAELAPGAPSLDDDQATGRSWPGWAAMLRPIAAAAKAPFALLRRRDAEVETGDAHPAAAPVPLRLRTNHYHGALRGWGGPTASDSDRYEGKVLAVRDGVLLGWIRDRKDRDRPVTLEIIANGRVLRTITASTSLPLAVIPPEQVQGHGFAVDIRSGIGRARPDAGGAPGGASGTVLVRVAGAGVILARDLSGAPPADPPTPPACDGYCDDSVDGHVRGWAWRPDQPLRAVDVAVFVDGQFLDRMTANRYREDVWQAGYGTGDYGFDVRLIAELLGKTERTVEVVEADTGHMLRRSPLKLARRRLTQIG